MYKLTPILFFFITFCSNVCYSDWTTTELIANTQSPSSVTSSLNEKNHAVVAWVSHVGSNYRLKAATYDSTSWTTHDLGSYQGTAYVTCSINEANQKLVAWSDYDGTNYHARAATFDPSSSTWTTQDLGAHPNKVDYVTSSLNESNQAIVAWSDYDGTNYHVQAATFDPSSSIWTTQDLGSNTATPGARNVTCNINDSNHAIVSWYDNDGTPSLPLHMQVSIGTFDPITSTWSWPLTPKDLEGSLHNIEALTYSLRECCKRKKNK